MRIVDICLKKNKKNISTILLLIKDSRNINVIHTQLSQHITIKAELAIESGGSVGTQMHSIYNSHTTYRSTFLCYCWSFGSISLLLPSSQLPKKTAPKRKVGLRACVDHKGHWGTEPESTCRRWCEFGRTKTVLRFPLKKNPQIVLFLCKQI